MSKRPTPGHAKIVSVTTVPVSTAPSCKPSTGDHRNQTVHQSVAQNDSRTRQPPGARRGDVPLGELLDETGTRNSREQSPPARRRVSRPAARVPSTDRAPDTGSQPRSTANRIASIGPSQTPASTPRRASRCSRRDRAYGHASTRRGRRAAARSPPRSPSPRRQVSEGGAGLAARSPGVPASEIETTSPNHR